MKKYLFFAIFFACCVFSLSAQIKSELQIGLASPQGDFADDDEDDAITNGSGVAGSGFYLGYKLLSPLKNNGLYWTINAGIMYNDLQSDYLDDFDDQMDDANVDDYTLPKYINVPIFAGLQYEKLMSDDLKLYGEAGLGLNIFNLTNYLVSEVNFEILKTFKPSVSLGYKIGGGIILNDKYTISLNYLGLGSHKVKYETRYEVNGVSETDDDKFEKALSVSSLNIILGVRF